MTASTIAAEFCAAKYLAAAYAINVPTPAPRLCPVTATWVASLLMTYVLSADSTCGHSCCIVSVKPL